MLVSVIREIPGKYRFFTSLTGKRGMRIVVPVLLLSITFAIFYPSLTHDFQYEWDDQWMVLRHPMLMDQSPSNIWYYFTHYDRGQYFPLNQLYYIGIYRLFGRSEEHTSELQSRGHLVCRLLLEKKNFYM